MIHPPPRQSGNKAGHIRYVVEIGNIKDVLTEVEDIHSAMENVPLDQSRCPLKYCIRTLAKEIKAGAQAIAARDRNVTVIICTQGRPTTRDGDVGSKIMREVEEELQQLSELPVKIIVRLCTDSEEVRDVYNRMDSRFDIALMSSILLGRSIGSLFAQSLVDVYNGYASVKRVRPGT
jgi:hypothetical protein